MRADGPLPSSFRDPSGFLFQENGVLFRQVNMAYRKSYEALLGSGLYQDLVDAGLMIAHEEVTEGRPRTEDSFRILRPERIPFISYPYEWCFSQLKDAALATLNIQKRCLEYGMSLKDASAYNIQFRQGRPVLIDTLSFEPYREGEPWVAYRQFCRHFLAPLALMARTDARLGQWSRLDIDGVPLDLAARLLPWRTRLSFPLLTHIHVHAGSEQRYADRPVHVSGRRVSKLAFQAIIESLEGAVRGLHWRPKGSAWSAYYAETNYSADAMRQKEDLVAAFVADVEPAPRLVWDLGANTGRFSRIPARRGLLTVAFDNDAACVQANYLDCVRDGETHVLPLIVDLTNPSSGVGWAHQERMSLAERGPADLVLALALVHHLAIGNNVPLDRIAEFLAAASRMLIIEFVPKSDSQVQRLLATRQDIFTHYTQEQFEREFGRRFSIVRKQAVGESARTLYLMRTRSPA